jgi:glycosyltransferase involved in cell wall biosynthesis
LRDDPQAFAKAVVQLLQEPEAARSLGQRAAQTTRDRFGWDRVAERFSALLHEAVGRKDEPREVGGLRDKPLFVKEIRGKN